MSIILISISTSLLPLALRVHNADAWILHHDSAPAYTALRIRQFLAERNIVTLEYPQIPPSGPLEFFFFPKIKPVLKEPIFSDIDSIKMAAMTKLKKISENTVQECTESWKRRMHMYFKVEGIT